LAYTLVDVQNLKDHNATLTLKVKQLWLCRACLTISHDAFSSTFTIVHTAHDIKLQRADHRHRDRFFQVPNAPGTCTNVQNACNPNLNAACWQH
jgi:hypothetical protein